MNQYLVKQDTRSVIFIKENLVYYQSDAIIEIAKLVQDCGADFIAVHESVKHDFGL